MLHHLHWRKRGAKKVEPYPARSWHLRLLDQAIYVVGIVGPVMMIPQLYTMYVLKQASGVSALSFGSLAGLNVVWILYGIAHQERPITITYSLWFLCNSLICLGALFYGA